MDIEYSEYGNDFLTLIDEDGEEFELEHLDTFEMNDELYMAFVPADDDVDSDDYGVILLKAIEEDDETLLAEIEDEEEEQAAYELFLSRVPEDFFEDDEFEGDD